MNKNVKERWHAVFIIILFITLVLLDFRSGILIFIPSYFIIRGLVAIRKKKVFLALTWDSFFADGFSTAWDRTEEQFTLNGKEAIKRGKRFILYGIIIFAIEMLVIVYLLINPV